MPKRDDIKKVMIISSWPIIIGQACEFDYSGTQACKALRKLGYEIVLVNSNPATIMTDPGMADVTYIEPLNLQAMTEIIEEERPDALLPNLGGQSGLNLSSELARTGVLEKYGVRIIGVEVDAIKRGEDRIAFKATMNRLGIEMPKSQPAFSVEEAEKIAAEHDDSYIRKAAIKYKVPYITTMAAATAAARGIAAYQQGHGRVKSLQRCHGNIK